MPLPVITLLTDFGLTDHYVAAMKGVILGICPETRLVDISHGIEPYNILQGAWTLSQAWPYFPAGTIHLVVVDPGVGSQRLPVVVEAGGHLFVAPDNGVLTMVLNAADPISVRAIEACEYFRMPVSRTFHGRDVFAPAAAHLAAGLAADRLGPVVSDPVRLPFGNPVPAGPASWSGTILHVDRFGNLITNFASAFFGQEGSRPFRLQVGSGFVSMWGENYSGAPAGQPFLIRGSSGYLEISINKHSAAEFFRVKSGDFVSIML